MTEKPSWLVGRAKPFEEFYMSKHKAGEDALAEVEEKSSPLILLGHVNETREEKLEKVYTNTAMEFGKVSLYAIFVSQPFEKAMINYFDYYVMLEEGADFEKIDVELIEEPSKFVLGWKTEKVCGSIDLCINAPFNLQGLISDLCSAGIVPLWKDSDWDGKVIEE